MSVVEKALPKAEVEVQSPVAICRRDACDKPFLAVVKVVDQMLVKCWYPEPERHDERLAYFRKLESKIPELTRLNLAESLVRAHWATISKDHSQLKQFTTFISTLVICMVKDSSLVNSWRKERVSE